MTDGELFGYIATGLVSVDTLARITGRTRRTIKAYMYGERIIPPDVAKVVRFHIDNGPSASAEYAELAATIGARIAYIVDKWTSERDRPYRESVRQMCQSCDEDGNCRVPDCPLRPVTSHRRVA